MAGLELATTSKFGFANFYLESTRYKKNESCSIELASSLKALEVDVYCCSGLVCHCSEIVVSL